MSVVSVFLSVPQMKKALKEQTFQVSKTNIVKEANAKIEMSKVLANRYQKAKASSKGFRFSSGSYKLVEGEGCECEGGKLTFKKVLRAVRPYAKIAGKKLVNVGADWLDGNTILTDKQIGGLKDSANKFIDGDNKGALQTLKKTGDEAIREQLDKIDSNVDESEATDGKGLKRKAKFVKGSQEAKDFMASLRAKRQQKGTGLVKDIRRGVSHVSKQVIKEVKKPVLTAVKAGLTAGLATASTEMGLTPVAGLMAANYLNKKIDKKWGNGIAYDAEPLGKGPYTLLNKIKPEMFVSKEPLNATGGSFLAPKSNGGSFRAAGGALPAKKGTGFLSH